MHKRLPRHPATGRARSIVPALIFPDEPACLSCLQAAHSASSAAKIPFRPTRSAARPSIDSRPSFAQTLRRYVRTVEGCTPSIWAAREESSPRTAARTALTSPSVSPACARISTSSDLMQARNRSDVTSAGAGTPHWPACPPSVVAGVEALHPRTYVLHAQAPRATTTMPHTTWHNAQATEAHKGTSNSSGTKRPSARMASSPHAYAPIAPGKNDGRTLRRVHEKTATNVMGTTTP